jgi:flagellar motor protein MotB
MTPWIAFWGLVGIFVGCYQVNMQIQLQQKQLRDTRFASSVELLGNSQESVRIGGIYNLYFLASEYSDEYLNPVCEILCAHMCTKTRDSVYQEEYQDRASNEIQTILDLLFKEKNSQVIFNECVNNLPETFLNGVNLMLNTNTIDTTNITSTTLNKVNFGGAKLSNAFFGMSELNNVSFMYAELNDVRFDKAKLTNVIFSTAKLNSVHFNSAKLNNVFFGKIELVNKIADDAVPKFVVGFADLMTEFRIFQANLIDVDFTGAELTDVDFTGSILENFSYEDIIKPKFTLGLTKYGQVITFNEGQVIKVTFDSGILFATNSSTLNAASKNSLIRFADSLKANPDTNVEIYGYSDSDENNILLSKERANSVKKILEAHGIDSDRIVITYGYGPFLPVADNGTEVGKAQNRRVEIYIVANEKMIREAEAGTLK